MRFPLSLDDLWRLPRHPDFAARPRSRASSSTSERWHPACGFELLSDPLREALRRQHSAS